MARSRIGVWLIGARGGVAASVALGLVALQKGITQSTGLVSELLPFSGLDLVDWEQLVLAGHDIRSTSLIEELERLQRESRAVPGELVEACREDILQIDARICPGTVVNVGPAIADLASREVVQIAESAGEAIARIRSDFQLFLEREQLERLIVVNVASTEPVADTSQLPEDWEGLEKLLDSPGECALPASSLYAIAAVGSGHAYVNFTPSLGSDLPAIDQLATQCGACHAGRDGKTGETLLKSVLAPMFARRNLEVMSWVGHNIFGNMDGQILDHPENKATKVTSKDQLLRKILGYSPQTLVSIEYIQSLGDWKTAWDHIHFQGFLGTPMTLQFTWQGCDSLLAAPLVLDLVRFTERAARTGQSGLLSPLASFFKSPQGTDEQDFSAQYQALLTWAASLAR